MRDLALIAILFGLAIVAGVTITPLMSIVFLVAARIVIGIWYDARQAYNAEMTLPREKAKRKNILTADGERLMITEDHDEQRLSSTSD
jgi:predicted RND superfamily exporter protein